ncbi:phospholipase-like protein [Tanacetum coccineum]
MTGSFREQYSLLREYAQELINQNPGTTVRIDVQQELNLESLIRTFRRVYECLGSLKQGQILTADEVDANNMIYPVAYAIVEAESKASWFWFLNLLGEDLGRAKCDLLLNNICEVFNRQLVDGKDQPIITCLEYIREYLVKRIVVVQKVIAKTIVPLTPSVTTFFDSIKKAIEYIVKWNGGYLYQVTGPYRDQCVVNTDIRVCSCRKWELTGIPCKHVVDTIYNMSKNSIGVGIPEQWVHAAYKLETWAHVYSLKVNPFGRPPEKRKKSHDEIASESCLSGKLSMKGNQVGGSSQAGARNVSGQAYARQDAGTRNVSNQAASARNASSQSGGSSQPSATQSTSIGERNA